MILSRRKLVTTALAGPAIIAANRLMPVRSAKAQSLSPLYNAFNIGTAILHIDKYFSQNGGVIGAGQSSGQRTTNATVLQNALNLLNTNVWGEIGAGIYEYTSTTGLTIAPGSAATRIVLRGGGFGVQLNQFNVAGTGAPALTIGSVSGSTYSGWEIKGIGCSYGASQTGLTASSTVVFGSFDDSLFESFWIGNGPSNPSYHCMAILDSGGGNFSCNYTNFYLTCWQVDGLHIDTTAVGSTGNHLDNFYLNNGGSNTHNATTGNYLNIIYPMEDMIFSRFNFEWGAVGTTGSTQGQLVRIANGGGGLTFQELHIEGIQFNGPSPVIFAMSAYPLIIDGVQIVDPIILSANMTGTLGFINDYIGGNNVASNVTVRNVNWILNNASEVNMPIQMYQMAGGPLSEDVSTVGIDFGRLTDSTGGQFTGNLTFDEHFAMPAGCTIESWSHYTFGAKGSLIDKMNLNVNAAYTHYGQFEDATLFVPGVMSGNFTITLAATMGATGTQLPRFGNTVHVRRRTGTITNTLTVLNSGQGNANLTTGGFGTGGVGNTQTTDAFAVWLPYVAATTANVTQGNWVPFTSVTLNDGYGGVMYAWGKDLGRGMLADGTLVNDPLNTMPHFTLKDADLALAQWEEIVASAYYPQITG